MAQLRLTFWIALLSTVCQAAPAIGQVGSEDSRSGTQTLRAEVRLVRVDITVLNRQGTPVSGLGASDFEVRDNGVVQRITDLEEHGRPLETSVDTKADIPVPNGVVLASNRGVNRPAVLNVILVDLLNTSKEDLSRANRQLIRFLTGLPPNDPVALMTMSSQVRTLVSFEAGAGSVAKYVASHGFELPRGAAPPGLRSSDEEALNAHMIDPKDENFKQIQKTTTESYARAEVELKGDRVQQSLNAFAALAEILRQYPGRKNVYWLSAGFPLQAQASSGVATDPLHPTDAGGRDGKGIDALQESTLKRLEQARIAIYPIDLRGVEISEIAGETGTDTEGLSASKRQAQAIAAAKGDQVQALQRMELLQIAKQTGGAARFSNDIAAGLKEVFQQGQMYYTLFYKPTRDTPDLAYHAIDVSVRDKTDTLSFRPGYFSPVPQSGGGVLGKEQFRLALTHGAPAGTGLVFRVGVSRNGDAANVEYSIESRDVEYGTDSAGQLTSDLDCAILEYSDRGAVTQTSLIEVTTPVNGKTQESLQAKQTIPLKPGAAYLSIGVRDRTSGAYGTLDVRLSALPAPPGPTLTRRTQDGAGTSGPRIQINVVVKNRQGDPVAGLEAKDFVVLDNKTSQTISAIETPGSTASATTQPVQVILLLDAVNTTFGEFSYAREQTLKFLRQNGGRLEHPTCLAVWSDQGLRAQLKATQDGNLLAHQLEATDITARTTLLAKDQHEVEDFQSSLQTLQAIAEDEAKIVGRKMLIWVGPGWPMLTGSGYNSSTRDKERDFAAIVDVSTALRQAQIALYNVSLKRSQRVGLRDQPVQAMRDMSAAEAPGASRSGPSMSAGAESADYKEFLRPVKSFHDADSGNLALQVLAIQSGGRVLDPGNDIAGKIVACEADANGFYSMSFVPKASKHPNEYHEVRLRVAYPGAVTQATGGFYGQP